MPSYKLIDGVERHEKYPDTFEIPSDKDKSEIAIGDFVKLGLELPNGRGERMWFRVLAINGKKFIGALDNNPIVIEDIRFGERLKFSARHIIGIWEY